MLTQFYCRMFTMEKKYFSRDYISRSIFSIYMRYELIALGSSTYIKLYLVLHLAKHCLPVYDTEYGGFVVCMELLTCLSLYVAIMILRSIRIHVTVSKILCFETVKGALSYPKQSWKIFLLTSTQL